MGGFLGKSGINIGQRDHRSFRSKHLCGGAADTVRRARDYNHTVSNSPVHEFSLTTNYGFGTGLRSATGASGGKSVKGSVWYQYATE